MLNKKIVFKALKIEKIIPNIPLASIGDILDEVLNFFCEF